MCSNYIMGISNNWQNSFRFLQESIQVEIKHKKRIQGNKLEKFIVKGPLTIECEWTHIMS